MDLDSRWSTDANGIATCLGLKAEPKVELQYILDLLETKICSATLFAPNSQ